MINTQPPIEPPERHNTQGQPRRVGVEIEFAGVPVRDAARIVQERFGGHINEHSAHRATVEETQFGEFTVELDAQIIHADGSTEKLKILGEEFDALAREAFGHAAAVVVPAEIVAPPMPWNQLAELTPLFDALRHAGASGTDANPLYGFGLHLNPEISEESADYVLRHLQAYVIMADWLRDTIDVDVTRRLLPHTDPFPVPYIKKILEPGYAPDMKTLIHDYVADNPTRNRELDLTVLFRFLDEDALKPVMADMDLIKPRPTFHYRLPNASLSDPNWNAVVEWNRWVQVEALAADAEALAARAADYLTYLNQPFPKRWLDRLNTWLES